MSAFDDTVHLKRLFEPRDENPCRDNKPYSIVTLEHLYVSGDPRLYDCVISEITLWKSRSLPNHEFVVAQVSYQGRIIGALRIERTIMPTDGPSANSSSVSLTSSPSSPGLRAHDPITIYTSEDIIAATRDSHKIAPYILTETVTIASVIAACFVLNQEYPVYQLPSKQCYWFAGLAFRLIAGDNVMQQMEVRDTRRAGDFGSFIHVMREPDMTQQAQTFRPKFEAKLQMIEDGVAERKRMLSAERRLIEMERQHRDEAERRREETEKRREETEKHREETERLKDEAERRKDEAERRLTEMERQHRDEAEKRREETEKREEAEKHREETERLKDEAERRKDEAERRLTEKERQNNALELELRRYRQMHLETTASEEPSRQL
ncbi:hypothetical protein AcW2_000847 [Taiwanofungus camphoratus]|nr:hypothetical protein AcW2_000847 [Antrodia cinnamomea]KAI0932145.1 hypothetical protein AcW2_000847 [Antrodia cinnamomea]